MIEEENKKILIVDDSPIILQILTHLLEDNPYELILARSGEEALRWVREVKPDLVLLDIDMPGIDGYETCRQLKKNKQTADIPVIFISAYTTVESKVKSFAVGGQDFISKPVQKKELIAHIKTHLTIKKLQQELENEVKEKQELIRVLTHDISTPLVVIYGQAELMQLTSPVMKDPYLKECTQLITKSVEKIHKIINHVREMEAVKSGKVMLELEPTALKEVFQEAAVFFRDPLEEKNLSLEIIPPLNTLETQIMAERVSFATHVMNNLLSNAIKFSFPGSTIQLEVRDDDESETVSIVLTDRGMGIPGEILKHIFSPSAPTSRRGTAGEKGTGFGMPIVKRYMELFAGEIFIRSKIKEEYPHDCGTEIRLTLKKKRK